MSILFRVLTTIVVLFALGWPLWNNWDAMMDSAEFPRLDRDPPTRTTQIPDFSQYSNVEERKIAFFSFLQPMVEAENERILLQRSALSRIAGKYNRGQALTQREVEWLDGLAGYYRVRANDRDEQIQVLKRRVDIIPDVMIQIQAANETGWGQSRFAQDARNFFGQWCWSEGCGIVPGARSEGANHEVRYFGSVEQSVRSYIRNLNTHQAYTDLRSVRAQLRNQGEPLVATSLTPGLMSYSERGEEYVIELNQMIRVNRPLVIEARSSEN